MAAAATEKTPSAATIAHRMRTTSPTRSTLASSASISVWFGWTRHEITRCRASAFESRPGVIAPAVLVGAHASGHIGPARRGAQVYSPHLGAAAIQVAAVMMTIAGSSLTYLTEGRVTKVGSGMLHLGFIVFAYVVVALQKSGSILTVFGIATALWLYAGAFTRALASDREDRP